MKRVPPTPGRKVAGWKRPDSTRPKTSRLTLSVLLTVVLFSLSLINLSGSLTTASRPTKDTGLSSSVPVIKQALDLVTVYGDEAIDIVISPDGRRAYVPSLNTDNLFVIDLASNQIVEVIDLWPTADHPLGPGPEDVALTPDGSRLLVTNSKDYSLTVMDTATHRVIETSALGCGPKDVAVSPDGTLAYVAVASPESMIKVIDLATVEETAAIPNQQDMIGPFAVAFSPDGSLAYVAMESGYVAIVDTTAHAVVDSIVVPEAGWDGDLIVSADGTTAYMA